MDKNSLEALVISAETTACTFVGALCILASFACALLGLLFWIIQIIALYSRVGLIPCVAGTAMLFLAWGINTLGIKFCNFPRYKYLSN